MPDLVLSDCSASQISPSATTVPSTELNYGAPQAGAGAIALVDRCAAAFVVLR